MNSRGHPFIQESACACWYGILIGAWPAHVTVKPQMRQEEPEFQANLGYIVRVCLNKKYISSYGQSNYLLSLPESKRKKRET